MRIFDNNINVVFKTILLIIIISWRLKKPINKETYLMFNDLIVMMIFLL